MSQAKFIVSSYLRLARTTMTPSSAITLSHSELNKPEPNTALASNSCPASLLNAGQQVATASCAPPFLSVADLGSPGPLVHTLERMRGHYERELVESIKRRPTPRA